jgi:hypothetical protein
MRLMTASGVRAIRRRVTRAAGSLGCLIIVSFLLLIPPAFAARAPDQVDQTDAAVEASPRLSFTDSPDAGQQLWLLPLISRTDVLADLARLVPGATIGDDGRFRLRGGRPEDVVMSVDGFRLERLAVPLEMIGALNVFAASLGPQQGDAAGGEVAVSIRSAGKQLRAGVGLSRDSQDDIMTTRITPTASGPLWGDRLSFALGATLQQSGQDVRRDLAYLSLPPPEASARSFAAVAKLSFQAHPAHLIEALVMADGNRDDIAGHTQLTPFADPAKREFMDLRSQPSRYANSQFVGVRWAGRLWSIVTGRGQVGYRRSLDKALPRLCLNDPERCEDQPIGAFDIRDPSFWFLQQRRQNSGLELSGAIDVPGRGPIWLQPRLSLTGRLRTSARRFDQSAPNPLSARPFGEVRLTPNDPAYPPSSGPSAEATSAQASVNLVGAARLWRRLDLDLSLGLHDRRAEIDDFIGLHRTGWSAQLRALWDTGGDGRTVVRAVASRRVSPDLDGPLNFLLGMPTLQDCGADRGNGPCQLGDLAAARTLGRPCGPTGFTSTGSPCADALAMPRTWEEAIGVRQVLPAGWSIDLDLAYRRTRGLPGTRETNLVTGPTGEPQSYRSGRPQLISDWSGHEDESSSYVGATGSLQHRGEILDLRASYTLSRSDQVIVLPGATGTDYLIELPGVDDRRHQLRVMASCLFPVASIGVVYALESGLTRSNFLPLAEGVNHLRPPAGLNPVGVVDPSDNYVVRLPAQQNLDLQIRLISKLARHLRLDVFFDVFNLLDNKKVDAVATTQSLRRGAFLRTQPGRWTRLGLEGRF